MKWTLRYTLITILMALGIPTISSSAPSKIIGLAGECNLSFSGCTVIPTMGSVVCPTTSNCPTRLAPDYLVETRMWGTKAAQPCRVSNDRGVTWANCPTVPGLTSTSIAGAGDGAVLVAGTTGANCQIQRSTDGGTSWGVVFDATVSGVAGTCSTSSSGSLIKCTIDNECVFIYDASGATIQRAITSTDYGVTWSVGGASAILGVAVKAVSFDGFSNSGLATTSGGVRAFLQTGVAVWTSTAIWAGAGSCWGSVVYNSAARGLCSTTAGTVVHTLRTGATGATEKTLTLPEVYPNGDANSGINGLGFGTNTAYVVGTVNKTASGQLMMGVWATRDDFTTMTKIFETNQPTGTLREGDVFSHQGCIWFSGGFVASMIGKVC